MAQELGRQTTDIDILVVIYLRIALTNGLTYLGLYPSFKKDI